MLPDFSALSLQEPASAESLPPELWEAILTAVETDDPCTELVKLCLVRKQWAALCRQDSFYDAINAKLGWYGAFTSLREVQADWDRRSDPEASDSDDEVPLRQRHRVRKAPPDTAKRYFQEACTAMRLAKEWDYSRHGYYPNERWDDLDEDRLYWSLDKFWKWYSEQPYYAEIAKILLNACWRGVRDWIGSQRGNKHHDYYGKRAVMEKECGDHVLQYIVHHGHPARAEMEAFAATLPLRDRVFQVAEEKGQEIDKAELAVLEAESVEVAARMHDVAYSKEEQEDIKWWAQAYRAKAEEARRGTQIVAYGRVVGGLSNATVADLYDRAAAILEEALPDAEENRERQREMELEYGPREEAEELADEWLHLSARHGDHRGRRTRRGERV